MTDANGSKGVSDWINGVKPEHRFIVERIDKLIEEVIPEVQKGIKWQKPSQPLGIPFYGNEARGCIAAMWSFKDRLGLGFFAGTLLNPEPPIDKMAGPWNRGEIKGRRIDFHSESEFDKEIIRNWLKQASKLQGWSSI